MIGSTAIEHHTNIVRFAWMEYSKMRKIPLWSFCLCSWLPGSACPLEKRLAMKSTYCCLRAGFLSRSLQRDFKWLISRNRFSGSFTSSLKGKGATQLPLSFLMNQSPWSRENNCLLWSDPACHHSLFGDRFYCRPRFHRLCGRSIS